MGQITDFAKKYFTHYNSGEMMRAGESLKTFLDSGNKLMITLGGAFSTAEGGKMLARLIREDKVHAISCTGANLEEDLFNLVAHNTHFPVHNWRECTMQSDKELREKGYNRVLDTALHDTYATETVEKEIIKLWIRDTNAKYASPTYAKKYWHEYFYELILSGSLVDKYQIDYKDSWLVAAAIKNIPLVTPGYEDSTMANVFAGYVANQEGVDPDIIKSNINAFVDLGKWYIGLDSIDINVGMLSLGGGISGDFPQCVLPYIQYDLEKKNVKHWKWFCQITDAVTSYGGFSGCTTAEKCSWSKLEPEWSDAYTINSDYTIVFPIIGAIVLGD